MRFFSKRENDTLKALEEKDRGKAFFECWTLKEAYVKATGDGLSRPTESFDVSFSPVSSARLMSVEGEPHEASRWSLKALAPEPGYAAAIAVEGHDWSLKCWSGSGPI